MAWLHLTCHHYCRPTNPGGLYDLRVNISWRHLVIAWKVLASVVLRMPPLLSGRRSPSPSSVPNPLTFSRAIWRHICLISHIHNCDVTFLSYCVFSPSFCLVSVWYNKRFWAWRLVAVEIGAIENWHHYYYDYLCKNEVNSLISMSEKKCHYFCTGCTYMSGPFELQLTKCASECSHRSLDLVIFPHRPNFRIRLSCF